MSDPPRTNEDAGAPRLKRRLVIVTLVMAAFGIAYEMRPNPRPIHRDEAWLQGALPAEVDGLKPMPGPKKDDKQTYRMSDEVYRILKPYGIDTQVFTDGRKKLDVCVIASNDRESFHDPMYCFPSQDWKILELTKIAVATKTRGEIPFSLMRAQHPGSSAVFAAYTYKGPRSMVTSQADLYMQWSLTNFVTGDPQEGAFYRFIGDDTTTKDQLLKFAADFMDKVKSTSSGVL